MRNLFGEVRVSEIPTGVDCQYFTPAPAPPSADLVFVGSMDWMPNIDGAEWFVAEILPRIRKRLPQTTVAIVGRNPARAVEDLAARTPGLTLSGTVPDVRPYLWGARVSVVPLRIGGGTRLKIYEAMAAMLPVVSTTVGAEGLPLTPGEHLEIADQPGDFAERCVALLLDESRRNAMAACARELVAARFSWESVATVVEGILAAGPRP
jgi:glycosyltransferase involved in cell wall biosynthesis